MARTLYLVAYDICQPRRLARVTRYFQKWRVAGQKSVPEIWVTPAELAHIQDELKQLVDPETDRLQIIALDPRMQRRCLGLAHTFDQQYFCIA